MVDIVNNQWNEADASNTNASPNGLQGGYAPNAIAPTIRQIMGAVKRSYVQNNAIYTSTGSAGNYILTFAVAPAALSKGIFYSFWPNHTNTGAATLNINALGAKSIIRNDGAALTASQITSGNVVTVVYDGTNFRLQSPTTNPTFTGQVDVGSLVSAGAITGTAGNLSSLGVTGDITLAGTLKVSPTNGINFANDDSITYNDTTNTWSFDADTTGGSITSTIATNKLVLTGPAEALRITTVSGDATSDPYLTFYKDTTRQGYFQHSDGTGATNGFNMYSDVATGGAIRLTLRNTGGVNGLGYSVGSTSYNVMHTGNGGTGSLFDADKVDGYEAANLYRHNASFATGGNLQISNSAPEIKLINTQASLYSGRIRVNSNNLYFDSSTDDVTFAEVFRFELDTKNGYVAGSKIVTLANDGAGSTVDADLLDGQHGAFYQNASNLNAGTLPAARLAGNYSFAALTLTDQITAYGGVQFANNDDLRFDDTTNTFTFTADGAATASKVVAGQFLDTGGNPTVHYNRVLTAGNGLSGGGGLDANRTITLGTPGTITNATTNSVTATSHTHALTLVAGDINGALGYTAANAANSIVAGNGLSGGGTLAASRTVTLGTPGTITSATTNSVTTTSHTHALTLTNADITDALTYTPANRDRVLTAGNGLSGGGALTADRTFTLGTPGSITNATTNAVTTSSHTHALGFTAAEVYTGSSAANTSFGVGHVITAHRDGALPATNAAMGVANRSDNDFGYINTTHSLAGTTLTGTWRSRGMIGTGDWVIMQRTA